MTSPTERTIQERCADVSERLQRSKALGRNAALDDTLYAVFKTLKDAASALDAAEEEAKAFVKVQQSHHAQLDAAETRIAELEKAIDDGDMTCPHKVMADRDLMRAVAAEARLQKAEALATAVEYDHQGHQQPMEPNGPAPSCAVCAALAAFRGQEK